MTPYLDERSKKILEFINPGKTDKILVIGTGVFPKIESWLFNNFKCRKITSGDINKKNTADASRILPELKFIYLDAEKEFSFKNNLFDKIILTEVLEHLEDEDFALKEIKRVLKKKGKLIISVPNKRWFNFFSPVSWIQHKREYSREKIEKVLRKNGFSIEKTAAGGNIYDLLDLWLHLIFKYLLGILHIASFFPEQTNKSWKKEFKGKGTDIIIRAGKS